MIADLGEKVANVATLPPPKRSDKCDHELSQISNHLVAPLSHSQTKANMQFNERKYYKLIKR